MSTNDTLEEIVVLQKERLKLAKEIHSKILSLFPVGASIHWEKGGHTAHGYVEMHSRGPNDFRLKVRNPHSNKTYWITFYDVQKAYGITQFD